MVFPCFFYSNVFHKIVARFNGSFSVCSFLDFIIVCDDINNLFFLYRLGPKRMGFVPDFSLNPVLWCFSCVILNDLF